MKKESAMHYQLPADNKAPAIAREKLKAISSELSPQSYQDLRLLVSEVVANSVRHANQEIVELAVEVKEDEVKVCVKDDGPGFEPRFLCDEVNGRGFGLYIVDSLSKDWGVSCNGSTCVWFSIERDLDEN